MQTKPPKSDNQTDQGGNRAQANLLAKARLAVRLLTWSDGSDDGALRAVHEDGANLTGTVGGVVAAPVKTKFDIAQVPLNFDLLMNVRSIAQETAPCGSQNTELLE